MNIQEMNRGRRLFIMSGALLTGIVLVPQTVRANGECSDIDITVQEIKWLPEYPALPTQLQIKMQVTYFKSCNHGGQAPEPADVQFRVVLLDCDGQPLGTPYLEAFEPDCATVQVIRTATFDLQLNPLRFPKNYRIDLYYGCNGQDGGDLGAWHNGTPTPVPVPLFPCSASLEQLNPYMCGAKGVISNDAFGYYKSGTKLYTLPTQDQTGANYGEAVNGEFIAPAQQTGQLRVKIEEFSPAVSINVSGGPSQPAWQVPPNTRQGVGMGFEDCMALQPTQYYQFNLRTDKSDSPSRFKVRFNWIYWDTENCCLQNDEKILDLTVENMRPQLMFPLDVRYNLLSRLGGGQDREMKMPACGTPQNPGNITDWFVMWPTDAGQVIQDGFAKGWKIEGNYLVSPEPDSVKYEFGS